MLHHVCCERFHARFDLHMAIHRKLITSWNHTLEKQLKEFV